MLGTKHNQTLQLWDSSCLLLGPRSSAHRVTQGAAGAALPSCQFKFCPCCQEDKLVAITQGHSEIAHAPLLAVTHLENSFWLQVPKREEKIQIKGGNKQYKSVLPITATAVPHKAQSHKGTTPLHHSHKKTALPHRTNSKTPLHSLS